MQEKRLDIAIVGMGAITPIGIDREQFWKAVLEGVDGIAGVPESRWNKALYYSEDRKKPDTTYSSIGAFVKGYSFDRRRFRVPPRTVDAMDPTQQMAVTASVEALEDAGVDLDAIDRKRVAVILGNALGGDVRHATTLRIRLAEVLEKLETSSELSELSQEARGAAIWRLESLFKATLPAVNEDTMPGELSNCIAGRVCNLLDLRGQSYTVDAACASSLAAMSASCLALRANECDLALTGGVDNSMGPETYVKFAKIGALSSTGSRPFDASADGFVLGEGCGVLALRRLEDVTEDQKIYAVIKSIGASSDGRGKGITAPNPKGQHLAIERAYESAGFDLDTVGYIEAHGTSTTLGDAIECRVLAETLQQHRRSEPLRIGSVKSQIGHLKSAAGVVGTIKAAMALKHKVFPPSINYEKPNEAIREAKGLVVQTHEEPWQRSDGFPRRAAVSSFGFGGTNFHVVLEEARPQDRPQQRREGFKEQPPSPVETATQVVAIGASDGASLERSVRDLTDLIGEDSDSAGASLTELIDARALHRDISGDPCRLAIATSSVPELKDQLQRVLKTLKRKGDSGLRLLANRGCFVRFEQHERGTLAMLFPGQGSQYVGMLDALRRRYDVVSETLDEADAVMEPILGRPLTDYIFGQGFRGADADTSRGDSAESALLQTTITQPAVLACDVALLRLLAYHNVRPDIVAGHSLGEYAACVAAGVLELSETLKIVAARGHHMTAATPEGGDPGWMAAVGTSVENVEEVLNKVQGYVVPANKNCSSQTIIAGASDSVRQAMEIFKAKGVQVTRLPVSHAFHTRVVASASEPLKMVLEEAGLREPSLPILSNVTGDLYPGGQGARVAIIELLSRQVASPVEFIAQIERMYDLGARTFIEVGPKRALASFVDSILAEQPHQAYITNHPKRGELQSFAETLAALVADGFHVMLDGGCRAKEDRLEDSGEADRALTSPKSQPGGEGDVQSVLIGILCEKTGYEAEEIELDFELEADLGIDTVKQAEVLAAVREHFGLSRDDTFRLTDYPSVQALIEYVEERASQVQEKLPEAPPPVDSNEVDAALDPPSSSLPRGEGDVQGVLISILCEKTGYESDEIELDFELEADLGIDTVKQAEVLAAVREYFGLSRDDTFRLTDYPSVQALIEYVEERASQVQEELPEAPPAIDSKEAEASLAPPSSSLPRGEGDVQGVLISILCEKTGYEADEIELDFELEADLGIDTVKQAEVLAAVREYFGLSRDDTFRLTDYPSVQALIEYVEERASQVQEKLPEAPPAIDSNEVDVALAPPSPSLPSVGDDVQGVLISILCEKTGYEADEIELDFELEADLGIDTVKQAEVLAAVREHFGLSRDDTFRLSDYPSVQALIGYVEGRAGGGDVQEVVEQTVQVQSPPRREEKERSETHHGVAPLTSSMGTQSSSPSKADAIVVSGVAAGLPGLDDPFEPEGFERLLEGNVLIEGVGEAMEDALTTKGIVRVVKHGAGEPEFIEVKERDQAIHLAGRGRDPRLKSRYGMPEELHEGFDSTTKWAMAAVVDALRDAGLPLIKTEHVTRSGRRLSRGFRLPEAVGRRTGVVFASAFAGYNRFADEIERQGKKGENGEGAKLSRSFIVQALAFAHAHVAQYIGAMGPNAQMNSACASTTIALATATDWIRAGRCERVIVVGADDATSDTLFPFVGAGFLAMGAATTEREVSKAALPFDRRRNGMIVGMGAVAMVVERASEASERGVTPIAEIVATRFANSAYSPVRLHPEHVAGEVKALVDEVEREQGLDRRDLSKSCVFMSHEPYTPARGGSAQAEIEALRAAFGDHARELVIANTKGYTGHALGAGLEEFVALRSLERQLVPPVPNLREPDEELGDLQLSMGGHVPHEYSLRLAAGFGSQVAVALFRRTCTGSDRVDHDKLEAWAAKHTVEGQAHLVVDQRHLQAIPGEKRPSPEPIGSKQAQRKVDFGDLGQGIRTWQVVTDAVEKLQDDTPWTGLLDKPVVVLGGGSLAQGVVKELDGLGASTVVIAGLDIEGEPDEVERALAVKLHEGGRPLGLINLLALDDRSVDKAEDVHRRVKQLFHIVRAMGTPERFVVTLTGLGGGCGVEPTRPTGAATAGAQAGFTKALAREWAEVTVKVVDLDVKGAENLASIALREGLTNDGLIEVGYGVDGRITTALRDTISVPTKGFVPNRKSVIVLTGGAGGITAAVGQELVRRGVGHVALLDLAPMLTDDPEEIDLDAERQRIKDELKQSSERVTPAKIEAKMTPFRAARHVAETIQAFRISGAEVFYQQCDLAKRDQVSSAIAAVRERFGRIDGVIHGAGLEVSQALEDKSPDIFDRVFLGKALGAIHLWRALSTTLPSFFVSFSSVAGRFGNMGQQDYSAANEVLARLGASSPPEVQALTIDWTAWDRIGMAANASMRALLSSRGVDLLPPEVGTTTLAELLLGGARGEVVICGRLGELASPRFVSQGPSIERGDWLDRIVEQDEQKVIAEVDLDPKRHSYLSDHEIDGTKVLPGVVGLELMSMTACHLLGGEGPFSEARDLVFERPVKVHEGRPVTLVIEALKLGDGVANVRLRSRREAASGRVLEAEHFRAQIEFGTTPGALPLERLCFDSPEDVGPDSGEMYGPGGFFHGPGFQVIEDAPRVAVDHLVVRANLPNSGQLGLSQSAPTTEAAPLSWEAVLQAAGLFIMGHDGLMALPHGIERAQRFSAIPDSGELVVRVAALRASEGQEEGVHRFDVEVLDEDGHLLQRAIGVKLIETGVTTHSGLRGFSVRKSDGFVERRDFNLEGLHDREELGRFAQCYLSVSERQRLDGFRSDKRRRELLGGRIAAKHLIKEHLRDRYGISVDLGQLEIIADSRGAPRPRLIDRPEIEYALPVIAITHCHDHAIVVLLPASTRTRVGVDLERIELRSPSFGLNVLTDGENDSLRDLGGDARDKRVTLYWALKEATSKALGLGLTLDPREMEVTEVSDDGSASIQLYGRARERYEELGGMALEARTNVEGQDAFAVVTLKLDGADETETPAVGDAAIVANHLAPGRLETWRNVC